MKWIVWLLALIIIVAGVGAVVAVSDSGKYVVHVQAKYMPGPYGGYAVIPGNTSIESMTFADSLFEARGKGGSPLLPAEGGTLVLWANATEIKNATWGNLHYAGFAQLMYNTTTPPTPVSFKFVGVPECLLAVHIEWHLYQNEVVVLSGLLHFDVEVPGS